MNDLTILPTTTCFDDCARWINTHGRAMPLVELADFTLVHGICKGIDISNGNLISMSTKLYVHSWLEHMPSDQVLDFGLSIATKELLLIKGPREQFYDKRNVQRVVRYHMGEAMAASEITGTSGPWRYEFMRLCLDIKPGTRQRFDPLLATMGQYEYVTKRRS